jgi:hypothetical protein
MTTGNPYKDDFSVRKVGAGGFFSQGSFSSRSRYGLAGALRAFKAKRKHGVASNLSDDDLKIFAHLIGPELKKASTHTTSISRQARAKIMAKAEKMRKEGVMSAEDKEDLKQILGALSSKDNNDSRPLKEKFYDDYEDDDLTITSGATASASARKQEMAKKINKESAGSSGEKVSLKSANTDTELNGKDPYKATERLTMINRQRLREGLRPLTTRQLEILKSQVTTDIIEEIREEERGKASYSYDPRSAIGKRIKEAPASNWLKKENDRTYNKSTSASKINKKNPNPLADKPVLQDIDFG